VRVLWLNTWFDPAKERDAALALVHQGADVLTNHSASPAVAQAAQEQGVHLLAYQSDMRRYAPHAQLTSVMHRWGAYYTKVARSVIDGRWTPAPVWGGLKDGFIELAPLSPAVDADTRALVDARRREIVSGRFSPFAGRLIDNDGRQRQAGGTMNDHDIATMNWFVQGVSGSLPR
jgi:simple sugar transport system substrate-binding protein